VKTGLIVALDVSSADTALEIVAQLEGLVSRYKVGKELFVAEGPGIVRELRERNVDVFLDLKFHDIPTTVARACREAAKLGVRWMTLHATGGSDMMRAARDALRRAVPGELEGPRLLAVTVLTSLDDTALREIGVDHTATGQVLHLARLAKASGMDGVVASVHEASMIREELGDGFLIVTPGVRMQADSSNDQKRAATPRDAASAGADYVVIGRSITASADPRQAAQRALDELTRRI
jgi:orotidine-5'-phosphate decarboxylase